MRASNQVESCLQLQAFSFVGDTGFEPVTSSVSGKRATAAPIARGRAHVVRIQLWLVARWVRDLNPCTRICSPLPRLSANPPRDGSKPDLRADDGIRTRDPHLGKVMRYHCATSACAPRITPAGRLATLADADRGIDQRVRRETRVRSAEPVVAGSIGCHRGRRTSQNVPMPARRHPAHRLQKPGVDPTRRRHPG